MIANYHDPEDGKFGEVISNRIDEACEYIGAYKDPMGMVSDGWIVDNNQNTITSDGNEYYTNAIIMTGKLIKVFIEWVLKYKLNNTTIYIPYLNDYQIQVEIYRL